VEWAAWAAWVEWVCSRSNPKQNSKKSKAVYNYNALATNLMMDYTIFKTGDD
jgi:hypothetical protein